MHPGGTRVTGRGLSRLGSARQLAELGLEASDVGDDGLGAVAALPNLRRLDLSETAVTDEGLRHLANAEKLRSLALNHTRVTDDGLAHLRDGFASLELAHTRVTDRGGESLRRGGQLARLRLAATGITNDALNLLQATAGVVHLGRLTDLEEVGLDGTRLTDAGVAALRPLSGQRRLRAGRTQVTDAALDTVGGLPALTDLDVRDTAVSPAALAAFRQAHPTVAVISGNTRQGYSPRSILLAVVSGLAVSTICVYGAHRYWLTWLFVRTPRVRASPDPRAASRNCRG